MSLPKSLTTVTTFSKILAALLFILFPFIGFRFGMSYQKSIDNLTIDSQKIRIANLEKELNPSLYKISLSTDNKFVYKNKKSLGPSVIKVPYDWNLKFSSNEHADFEGITYEVGSKYFNVSFSYMKNGERGVWDVGTNESLLQAAKRWSNISFESYMTNHNSNPSTPLPEHYKVYNVSDITGREIVVSECQYHKGLGGGVECVKKSDADSDGGGFTRDIYILNGKDGYLSLTLSGKSEDFDDEKVQVENWINMVSFE